MPSRPVLPLRLRADAREDSERRRNRFRFDGAAALSAVLHGGLLAALIFLLGGGGGVAGMPSEEGVMFVAVASASELGGGQPDAAPTQAAQDDTPLDPQQSDPQQPDPLQAAIEPAQPTDDVPLKFEKAEVLPDKPKPQPQSKPQEKPKQTARKQPAKSQPATTQATNTGPAGPTTSDQAPGGPAGTPGNSASGNQVASLTPGPVGAFNGLALTARFRTRPTPPPYPRRAEAQNQQGVVMVRALIDERGHAQDIRVYASSGYPLLDRAALDAVAQWDFLPAAQDGKPVAAWVEMPVRFNLN